MNDVSQLLRKAAASYRADGSADIADLLLRGAAEIDAQEETARLRGRTIDNQNATHQRCRELLSELVEEGRAWLQAGDLTVPVKAATLFRVKYYLETGGLMLADDVITAPGWYYYDEEYPEEGSVGPFNDQEELRKYAVDCGEELDNINTFHINLEGNKGGRSGS